MQRLLSYRFGDSSGPMETKPDVELGLSSHKKAEKTSFDARVDTSHTLEKLFAVQRETVSEYPGIQAYTRYLEASFKNLLEEKRLDVWEALGFQHLPTTNDCWDLLEVVLSVPSNLWSGKIDELANEVIRHYSASNMVDAAEGKAIPRPMEPITAKDAVSSALLPILGWTTMITSPTHNPENPPPGGNSRFSVKNEATTVCSLNVAFDRTITSVLKRFHQRFAVPLWKSRNRDTSPTATPQDVTLEISCIKLATLQDIANIHIVWVDDIQSHLAFDKVHRRLCIFRFPSFSALSVLDSSNPITAPVLEALVNGFESGESIDGISGRHSGHRRLHQEMLITYRMLFAPDSGSRRRAKKLLGELKGGVYGPAGEKTPANQYDKMLDVLCTLSSNSREFASLPPSLWPSIFRSVDDELKEQNGYNAEDFPIFGQRLEYLQKFVRRQQPSRLTDMWLDKRNMFQWYTFWAVLIFGGFSILIGILQLAVSIGQLAASF